MSEQCFDAASCKAPELSKRIKELEARLEGLHGGIRIALYESDHLDDAQMHMREYFGIHETGVTVPAALGEQE
jgi:hypothetical protein